MHYTAQKLKIIQRGHGVEEHRVWCGSFPKGSLPCPLDYAFYSGSGPAVGTAQVGFKDSICGNKAYDRLINKLGASSQMLVNGFEHREAINMVVKRSKQIRDAFLALKKGRVDKALKALEVSAAVKRQKRELWAKRRPKEARAKGYKPRQRRRWDKPKDLSSTWLEYHFGWEPMMQDIYNACKSITGAQPYELDLTASASRNEKARGGHDPDKWNVSYDHKWFVKMGCRVSVSNPNTFLASQLGLLNPFSVAWELVPFSFVVDWFTSVGSVLGSMTNFAGLTVTQAYTTYGFSGSSHIEFWNTKRCTNTEDGTGVRVKREIGIKLPKLGVRQFKGFSPVRGATAIALVVGVFSKHLH